MFPLGNERRQRCANVDVVTGGIGGIAVGLEAARALGKPFVEAHLQPVNAPSEDYPAVLLPWLPRGLRRVGQWLSESALWMSMLMKRPAPEHTHKTALYGFSPEVVAVQSDRRKSRQATGYWQLTSDDWRPPPEVEAFLSRPGRVVSIGFGSMASQDPAAVAQIVAAAARGAKTRVVLLTGWGGMQELDGRDDVLCVKEIPHDWLCKRVDACVHHCGAGTTGAALTAGIPSVCVPFTMDQPFWASRIRALGGAAEPIPRRKLSVATLQAALTRVLEDDKLRSRAAALGKRLTQERGVDAAVAAFRDIQSELR